MPAVRSKIAALLLLLFAGSGLIAAVSLVSAKPMAACHGQTHSRPTQQSGYKCCIVGHSEALQSNFGDLFVPLSARADVPSQGLLDRWHDLPTLSLDGIASPPRLMALRI